MWGDHVFIEDRTVDVHIRRLRDALSPFGEDELVETVRGTGYRLAAPRSCMKPIVRQGLLAPGVLALITGAVWLAAGAGWALVVLAAGAAAIIGFHLYYLQQFTDWASGPLDAQVPVGAARGRRPLPRCTSGGGFASRISATSST